VALEFEKNGKLHCNRNGCVKAIDVSDISLHSSSSKVSNDSAVPRKGLHEN